MRKHFVGMVGVDLIGLLVGLSPFILMGFYHIKQARQIEKGLAAARLKQQDEHK